MSTWKLSIKPDSEKGREPFELCRRKSLVAVGWSYIWDDEPNISTKDESYDVLRAKEKGYVPRTIERLLDEVKVNDLVWLHRNGKYFLCTISDSIVVLGPQIDKEFRSNDLGHARNARWVEVPEVLVPGRVQRSLIVSRTIQMMDCSKAQEAYFRYLHSQLSLNSDWFPDVNEDQVSERMHSITQQELRDILTPDDYEDIVAAYLQSQGWTLVKSTCFRTKPEFEFRVVRSGPKYGHVQVKSGNVQLSPSQYGKWVSDRECVFLFSTHLEPYTGPAVQGVNTISETEIMAWVADNPWVLSVGVMILIQLLPKAS